MTSWLLVADSRRAKIFSINDKRFDLREIADLAHPSPSQRGESPAGRVFATQSGARHGLEPAMSPEEKDKHAFAAEIALYLQDNFAQRRFSDLTVAAAPEFLGELRAALPDSVGAAVSASLNKNLLSYSDAELSAYLREHTGLH